MDHNDKCIDCKSCLDYTSAKDNQLIFKCLKCNTNYNKDLNKDLINRFVSTYEFCDGNINKFILLLRKCVYPYEYMNTWERFDKVSLPNKEDFYSSLNMEEIKMLIICMQKKSLKYLIIIKLVIIMIFNCRYIRKFQK